MRTRGPLANEESGESQVPPTLAPHVLANRQPGPGLVPAPLSNFTQWQPGSGPEADFRPAFFRFRYQQELSFRGSGSGKRRSARGLSCWPAARDGSSTRVEAAGNWVWKWRARGNCALNACPTSAPRKPRTALLPGARGGRRASVLHFLGGQLLSACCVLGTTRNREALSQRLCGDTEEKSLAHSRKGQNYREQSWGR